MQRYDGNQPVDASNDVSSSDDFAGFRGCCAHAEHGQRPVSSPQELAATAAARVPWVAVTAEPLSLQAHIDAVTTAETGAVTTFVGQVRRVDHGREVVQLTYSAHPQAAQILADIAQGVTSRFPLQRLVITHTVGDLHVGEPALIVAMSGLHRHETLQALTETVEDVKRLLPVWKHQKFADGTDEWVNCP